MKITEHFTKSKTFFIFFVYINFLISTKGYENAGVRLLTVKETGIIWVSMKNVQHCLGVQSISDLVLQEIYSIYKTKNPANNQIKKHKMTEKEMFEKYANLSENELNVKNNKEVYAKNDVMTTVIKRCRSEKKRGKRKIDAFRKKLMVVESEISKCPEFEVKSKIGNIFVNEKILEDYSI